MSQYDVLNILKNNKKKWFSKSNLRGLVDCNDSTLTRNISKLTKYSSTYGLKTKKGKKGKNFIRFD
jgi:hypothetical protein